MNRKTSSSGKEVESLRQELLRMQEQLSAGTRDSAGNLRRAMDDSQSRLRSELSGTVQTSLQSMGTLLTDGQKAIGEQQSRKLEESGKHTVQQLFSMRQEISSQLTRMNTETEARMQRFSEENGQKLDAIRQTVEKKLSDLQTENTKKLDEMRQVVDEKLQKTLEDRMTQSFKLVSERLEAVYKGLGEMQTLASGVGDLKKVLSNVKTRGILGEIQLGAILEEILAPEQYETNFVTKKGSRNPVEYAVKLPTEDGSGVYLPIDSKFPGDAYQELLDAYDSGEKARVDEAAKILRARILLFAKDISDKYIDPPNTTDFAVMFLPFEGLYAEAVNRGMVEELQSKYKINLAGPSTMAALLNSLQMGFRSFAIQKRSGEVWEVLGGVKTEFDKFGDALEATQKRLEQANKELDKLVGVRTRQIQRKLRGVTRLDPSESQRMFALEDGDSLNEEV
ncbi:MAG TPA: DNA recombination protein RmuC [Candidatus Gallacutalibacter pullistercoris]|nr:DNA recombination protein RmuC [Candidatus Gallacutalibacter pullistercoris]